MLMFDFLDDISFVVESFDDEQLFHDLKSEKVPAIRRSVCIHCGKPIFYYEGNPYPYESNIVLEPDLDGKDSFFINSVCVHHCEIMDLFSDDVPF